MKRETHNQSTKNVFGIIFFAIGLIFILAGFIGAKVKLNNICDIQDIFKGSDRGERFVYFDINKEPILVGEDGGLDFYLLRGEKYFHIAVMNKEEFSKVSAEVKKEGKARVIGVTKYLKDTCAEGEIAQSCEDMFHMGVISDNLYMFVGDVYIDYRKADYFSILADMYMVRIICGVILLVIGFCIMFIRSSKVSKNNKDAKPAVESRKSYVYKGKWAWEAASIEYRRIKGKSEDEELTQEENGKIYDYAMMPLSYFFGWLCERDLIGKRFTDEFGEESIDILDSIKNHRRTPLEALADFDYYFTEDWLKEEVKYFFLSYYLARNNSYTDDDVYLYDYLECNGAPDGRYYCMEYSYEAQSKINSRIDDLYAKSRKNIYDSSVNERYYDEEDNTDNQVVDVHSTFFDTKLEVEKAGPVIKGVFPEDYALKCLRCLDNMSQKEWHRYERWIMDNYGVEADEAKINRFRPFLIEMYEPQYDGDIAFVIEGGADYEDEHGISFTVRNGIMLDWGYAMESREPYDEKLIKRYEMYTGEIDFENLKNQNELEKYVSEGKLIRTYMLPEWLGGENTGDNMVVVTPEAYEHMQMIFKRLKMIKTYVSSTFVNGELRVIAKAEYCEDTDGTKLLVPMNVSYNTHDNKSLRIFMWEKVWE